MAKYQNLFTLIRAAQRIGRSVTIDGIPWLIYELPPLSFDRVSSRSLVFESDDTVRRLRDFPAGWRSLGDEELSALTGQLSDDSL
jgi:hypothetical protein